MSLTLADAQTQTIGWLNRFVWIPGDRENCATKIAAGLNELYGTDPKDFPASKYGDASELKTRGVQFVDLGLSAERLAALRAYFTDKRPNAGGRFYHPIREIVGAPDLLEIATSPDILGLVARYLGTAPVISNIACWWLPAGAAAEEDQAYHRDRMDVRFCKLFIYLTDVGPEDGPHEFVPGTHDWRRVKERLIGSGLAEDSEAFANAWRQVFQFGSFRDMERETTNALKAGKLTVTGPAGTAFLEDTYGIHRATSPLPGHERLMFMVLYGLNLDAGTFSLMRPLRDASDWQARVGPSVLEQRAVSPWVGES